MVGYLGSLEGVDLSEPAAELIFERQLLTQ